MMPLQAASASAESRVPEVLGMARLVRLAYVRGDVAKVWGQLFARVNDNHLDAAALLDLSTILLTSGDRAKALSVQNAALEISRSYEVRHGGGGGLRVLAFVAPGDLMANTPIDFLLEHSNATLILHYVHKGMRDLSALPVHDVAFVAIGESEQNRGVLAALGRLLEDWPGPVMNKAVGQIAALTRDGVASMLEGEDSILAPATVPIGRAQLEALASGGLAPGDLMPGAAFPIIVRPMGSHAGHGLAKLESAAAIGSYLFVNGEQMFYVAPFIDYAGADGMFRKQRIAFIDGAAFPCHFAVSEHWMVHYLSAGMTTHPERRAEEAEWMANFAGGFARRHARAFDTLCRRIGLDYFVIDCAEMPDGRLLLFEADVAMIVHSMDAPEMFPYKEAPMTRLFAEFERALLARTARRDR